MKNNKDISKVLDMLKKKGVVPDEGVVEIEVVELEPMEEELEEEGEMEEEMVCPHCGMPMSEEEMEDGSEVEIELEGLPEGLIDMIKRKKG